MSRPLIYTSGRRAAFELSEVLLEVLKGGLLNRRLDLEVTVPRVPVEAPKPATGFRVSLGAQLLSGGRPPFASEAQQDFEQVRPHIRVLRFLQGASYSGCGRAEGIGPRPGPAMDAGSDPASSIIARLSGGVQ